MWWLQIFQNVKFIRGPMSKEFFGTSCRNSDWNRDGHGKKSIRVVFFTFFQRNRGIIISRGDIEIPNTAFESWDNELSEKKFFGAIRIFYASIIGPEFHLWVQKSPFSGGWKRQKWLMSQKIDFSKVRDINTPIQPRKKKHKNNVSSALKTF